MSVIAHESKAQQTARRIVAKLQHDVPRQLIKVVIQAKVGTRVIARGDIKPFRKDVTAKCVSNVTIFCILLKYSCLENLSKTKNFDVVSDQTISMPGVNDGMIMRNPEQ